jgi:hypothetical protein
MESETRKEKEKEKKRTWSSEHRTNFNMVMSADDRRVANIDAKDISILVLPDSNEEPVKKEETKAEEVKVEAEEKCEDELADNPPSVEEEEEAPEDGWFCLECSESPCQFLQWQEELERIVDCMNPDASNKQKRFQLYQHVSRRRNGPMGKGNRRQLPSCFERGMRDLYPSEKYTGYSTAYDSGPDDGSKNLYTLNRPKMK